MVTLEKRASPSMVSEPGVVHGTELRESRVADVFAVCDIPDGGDFATGNSAGLAWDILHRTATHRIPDVVDLSGCVHLKPYSLACLCGLGAMARVAGTPIRAIPPVHLECAQHLVRLGIPEFLPGEWERGEARETNIVAKQVEWPPSREAERIVEVLAPRAALAAGVFPEMVAGLDEIMRNALTHSLSPIDCIVVGQAFPQTEKVEIAVLDLGQTIKNHLVSNPEHAHLRTDQAAILKAMEEGVTGTPNGQRNRRGEPNSGAGLPFIRQYCEGGGGELTVLSGEAWATFSGGRTPVMGDLRTRFQGCLVNIRYFTGRNLPPPVVVPIL